MLHDETSVHKVIASAVFSAVSEPYGVRPVNHLCRGDSLETAACGGKVVRCVRPQYQVPFYSLPKLLEPKSQRVSDDADGDSGCELREVK